jgi:PAS domain S-box-containing protein
LQATIMAVQERTSLSPRVRPRAARVLVGLVATLTLAGVAGWMAWSTEGAVGTITEALSNTGAPNVGPPSPTTLAWVARLAVMCATVTLVAALVSALLAERRIRQLNQQLEHRVASRTAELRESEAKWRSLVENAPDFILILDGDGTIRFINRTVTLPADAIVGTNAYDQAPSGGEEVLRDALARVFGKGETVTYEFTGTGPNGTVAWYSTTLAPMQYDGRPAAVLVARDVTTRKMAEGAFRDKTEQLEAVRRAMTSFVGTGDTPTASQHLLAAALAQTESEYGFIGVMIGERRPFMRILAHEGVVWHPQRNRRLYEDTLRRYGEGGYLEFSNFDNLFGHVITGGKAVLANDPGHDPRSGGLPDGHPPLRSFLGVPVHHGGRVVGMIGVANREGGYTGAEQEKIEILTDTAGVLYDAYRRVQETERLALERERAARALRESEERFSEIAESINEVFWAFDPDFSRTLYINQAYERITGYTRASIDKDPRSWERVIHPDDLPHVQKEIARLVTGDEVQVEFRMIRPDGTIRRLRSRGFPVRNGDGKVIRLVGITEDVTAQRQAEEEAQRHQAALAHVLRLRTMGAMAGQLAHEINQPLGAIANFANGLVTRLSDEPNTRSDVRYAAECIAREALRAGEIIRQIRRFVEKRQLNRAPEDVDTVIRDAVVLVQPEARRLRVALRLDLGGGSGPIDIDAIHIQQVVLDLLRNAIESVVERGAGPREVVIRTEARADGAVEVTVADTGVGLPPDSGKLFDPFFTTKSGGLGLGLAIARSIVIAHGGDMMAAPNDGGGAIFRFILPRVTQDAAFAT